MFAGKWNLEYKLRKYRFDFHEDSTHQSDKGDVTGKYRRLQTCEQNLALLILRKLGFLKLANI